MDNLGELDGVTDNSDDNDRSDRDLVGQLARMTARHRGRAPELVRQAISNLRLAAQLDSRLAPVIDKAIAALSGPEASERDTTSVDKNSGGGALSMSVRRAY
jgi:hypothetical protein